MFFTAGLALLFAIGQICGRVRYFENYVLAGLLVCLSALVFQVGIIVNNIFLAHPGLLFFHGTVLYCMAPLAYCSYYLVILPVETMSRRFLILFAPVAIGLAADAWYLTLPETDQFALLMDLFAGANGAPAKAAKLVVLGAGLQMFLYLGYLLRKLFVTRHDGDSPAIPYLLMLTIVVTTTLTTLVILGYLLGSSVMFRWGTNVAGILVIGAYFMSRRYPKVLQFLMVEAEKKYYARSLLEGVNVTALIKKLGHLMEHERIYTDDQLTLRDLADELSITPHQLSQLLNERLNTNFNTFVNQHRIRDARDMLLNHPGKTVLAVSLEVGFNSKSAFYEAFSRFTGMTPQNFRKGGGR